MNMFMLVTLTAILKLFVKTSTRKIKTSIVNYIIIIKLLYNFNYIF